MSCDLNKGQVQKKSTNKILPYDHSIEQKMALVYTLYSEKDRRLYAAAEAIKLGYGGNSYISRVLGCDRKTILQGILELNHPELIEKDRLRTKGGGRKTSLESISDLDVNFLEVIFFYTAGDPMDDKVRWTHLTYAVQIDQNSCSTMAPCKLLTKSDSIRVSGGFQEGQKRLDFHQLDCSLVGYSDVYDFLRLFEKSILS
jgi:hypothetical protein